MTAATFPVHRDLAGFNLAASRAAKPQVQHLQLKVKAVVHAGSDHKIYKLITAIAIYYKQLIRLRPAQIGMNSINKIDFQGVYFSASILIVNLPTSLIADRVYLARALTAVEQVRMTPKEEEAMTYSPHVKGGVGRLAPALAWITSFGLVWITAWHGG